MKPDIPLEMLLSAWSFKGFISSQDAVLRLRSGRTTGFGLQFIHALPRYPLTGDFKPGKLAHYIGLICDDGRWIVSEDGTWRVSIDVDQLLRQAKGLLYQSGQQDRFTLVNAREFRILHDSVGIPRSDCDAL